MKIGHSLRFVWFVFGLIHTQGSGTYIHYIIIRIYCSSGCRPSSTHHIISPSIAQHTSFYNVYCCLLLKIWLHFRKFRVNHVQLLTRETILHGPKATVLIVMPGWFRGLQSYHDLIAKHFHLWCESCQIGNIEYELLTASLFIYFLLLPGFIFSDSLPWDVLLCVCLWASCSFAHGFSMWMLRHEHQTALLQIMLLITGCNDSWNFEHVMLELKYDSMLCFS